MSTNQRKWTSRLEACAFLFVYVAASLMFFWYLWTPITGGQLTFKYDPLHEYWADLKFQFDTLSQGEFALWNPYDRGGYPTYGDPQLGALYPLNWLLLGIAALVGDVHYWLMELKVMSHWVLGAVGMHLFLRRQDVSEPSAYVGGILFAFSAPAIRYGGNALNWTYAWIPWALLALWYLSEKPTYKRALALGVTMSMAFLSGSPAVFWYLMVIATPYGAYRLWAKRRIVWRPMCVAVAVTLLLCLYIIIGNLDQLSESVRDRRDIDFITNSAFHTGHLLNLVAPGINGEIIYYTSFSLIAIGLVWLGTNSGQVRLFTVIGAVGILLALGKQAGVLPSLASLLPPFTGFRQAHRYLYVTSAALSVASALAIHQLVVADEERKAAFSRTVSICFAIVVGALLIGSMVSATIADKLPNRKTSALVWACAISVVYFGFFRGLMARKSWSRTVGLYTLAVVVFVDLWVVNYHSHMFGTVKKPDLSGESVLKELKLDAAERIYDDGRLQFRPGTRLGIKDFSGYEDDPLRLKRYDQFREASRSTPSLLGHAGVRYYLPGKKRLIRTPPPGASVTSNIVQLNYVAPAIQYVANPVDAKNSQDALQKLRAITPGEGAVIEGVTRQGTQFGVAEGQYLEFGYNRLVARITTPGPGYVVINEAYFSKWRATVDGITVPILPANGMFRAVEVDAPGDHTIVMELSPGAAKWALWMSILTWVALLVLGIREAWIRIRAPVVA